jgi:hypothetical protein
MSENSIFCWMGGGHGVNLGQGFSVGHEKPVPGYSVPRNNMVPVAFVASGCAELR